MSQIVNSLGHFEVSVLKTVFIGVGWVGSRLGRSLNFEFSLSGARNSVRMGEMALM